MNIKKVFSLVLLTIGLIVLGAWRQIFFINTNALIAYKQGRLANSGLLEYLSFLNDYNLSTLGIIKWSMTLVFTLLFLALSLFVLWILFADKSVMKLLIYSYLALILISGLFFIIGKYTHHAEIGYTIARRCMGALQSPFPLMFLIAGYHLNSYGKMDLD